MSTRDFTQDPDHDVNENDDPNTVSIRDESIRLGQLLKLSSLVEDGVEAKGLIEAGEVRVNGKVETRRGRQVRDGDTVTLGDATVTVSASAP